MTRSRRTGVGWGSELLRLSRIGFLDLLLDFRNKVARLKREFHP
jgi:hypothetical protein